MDSGDKPGRCQIHSDYTTCIEKAGGIPFPIPFTLGKPLIPDLVARLNGILFTGGDDLDPSLYGQTWHQNAVPVNPARQEFEFALLAEVERRRLPVMGICLGCQVLNVYRGGSLHQFLPDVPRDRALEHRKLEKDLPAHEVEIDPGSRIGSAIGKARLAANTYHKQAISTLGRGLRTIATAPDGVIEGIEDPEFPLFAAVQWHPERLGDSPEHLAIFRLLVQRAQEFTAR